MNRVDRQHYIVDNPKVAIVEIKSILDIISHADEDSLRRMMRHARAYMKPHNFDKVIRESKGTYPNEQFKNDETYQLHRNEIMKSIYNYVEHIFDSHDWDEEAELSD